ncbi:ABC transporter permease [Salinactinospora qingdaonensis]|uniref:ABC transporter permease n=1 Tax=Salinactinospora qingdaonensis TaxID=702744 RepID=A0ABP7GD56_9ACTN
MARFLARRLLDHALVLLVAASCGYLLAATALDPRGNYTGPGSSTPPHVVESMLREYNLSDRVPLAQRYVTWVGGVVTGDFGQTWDGREVAGELARRIGVSARLLAVGFLGAAVTGVFLGAWTGARRGGVLDTVVTLGSFVLISVPTVVVAVSLQTAALWFNAAVGVDVLRTTGEFTPGVDTTSWAGAADRARHLVLPTLALALPMIALYSRYQRALMIDEADADYVRTARAKGRTRGAALFRHALPMALLPTVTYIGYSAALVFVGSVFVEKVFGWHGVGELLVDSIARGDVNTVAAVCCFGALCVAVAGLLADVAQMTLDPRLRVR